MLLKIIVVGALVIGVMAAVKDGRILRDAGLLSSCSPVLVSGQSDSTLLSCTKAASTAGRTRRTTRAA